MKAVKIEEDLLLSMDRFSCGGCGGRFAHPCGRSAPKFCPECGGKFTATEENLSGELT